MGCAASVSARTSTAPGGPRRASSAVAARSASAAAYGRHAAPGLKFEETPPAVLAHGRSSDAHVAAVDAGSVGMATIAGPLKPILLTGDYYQRQAAKRTRRQKLHRRRLDRIVAAERYSESVLVQSDRLSLRSLSSRAAFSTRMCTPATPRSSGASGCGNFDEGVARVPDCDPRDGGGQKDGPVPDLESTPSEPTAANQASDGNGGEPDIGKRRTAHVRPRSSEDSTASAPLTIDTEHASRPSTTDCGDDDGVPLTSPRTAVAIVGVQSCHRVPNEEPAEQQLSPLQQHELQQLRQPLQQKFAAEQAADDCLQLAVRDALAPPHEFEPLRAER